MEFRGYYINLDINTKRKEQIENELQREKLLDLFTRVTPKMPKDEFISKEWSTLTFPKKSLYETTIAILEEHREDKHLLLFEDDIVLTSGFKSRVTSIIQELEEVSWDITLFDCDIDFRSRENISQLQKKYETFNRTKEYSLLDANEIYIAGNSAMLFNKNSLSKIIQVFEEGKRFGAPKDLLLKYCFSKNILKALVTFPFITTVSKEAENSNLSCTTTESMKKVLEFRRSFFYDEKINIKEKIQESEKLCVELNTMIKNNQFEYF